MFFINFFFAVLNQRYEVHVEDAFAMEGSDTLFKCVIPDFVKDFVSITSWVKDGSLNIFPHSGTGKFIDEIAF